jgi:hypothetical protein
MQSQHYAAAALGREWIAAWNSHDLERIFGQPSRALATAVIASQRVARMRAQRRAQLRSRSDDRLREAIHPSSCGEMDCFASLAMTEA